MLYGQRPEHWPEGRRGERLLLLQNPMGVRVHCQHFLVYVPLSIRKGRNGSIATNVVLNVKGTETGW